MDTTNTKGITFYLKGAAISIVLINHYVNHYVSNQFLFYANGVVSVFFVLSGYGIFHSLQNALQKDRISLKALLSFYCKRLARIVPLYWLSLLIISYFDQGMYPLRAFLLDPLTVIPGPYWFVRLLVQCYLIAPFLYYLLARFGHKIYIIYLCVLMFLAYNDFSSLAFSPDQDRTLQVLTLFSFRYAFLGHIWLFALGMVIPSIISDNPGRSMNRVFTALSFLVFALFVYCTRPTILPLHYLRFTGPLLVVSSFAFCFFLISANPKLPIGKIFMLLGTYSYSLYLFHHPFYRTLSNLGIIKYYSLQGTIYTILLFPIFLLICISLEKISGWLITRGANLRILKN